MRWSIIGELRMKMEKYPTGQATVSPDLLKRSVTPQQQLHGSNGWVSNIKNIEKIFTMIAMRELILRDIVIKYFYPEWQSMPASS